MPPAPVKEEKTIGDIYQILLKHFEDDSDAFDGITAKFIKSDQIAIDNGEHMSFIRKDLTEVNEKITKLADIVGTHIKDVTPILQKYRDGEATKRVLVNYGKGAVGVGTVIGAFYVIKEFIISKLLR